MAPTIGEWIETFLNMKRSEGRRSATLKDYAFAGRLLAEHFGENERLDKITSTGARRFATALRNGELSHIRKGTRRRPMGRMTTDKYLRFVRALFESAAVEFDELIRRNPFKVVKLNRVEPRRWHKVTPDEFWRLYEAANDGWKILLSLCRLGGLRRSDALALKWSNVTLGGSTPVLDFVQIKTERRCVVPLFPELAQILRGLPRPLKLNAPDAEYVVPRSVYVGNIGRDFKVLCRSAGVTPYNDPLHSLRKSAIDDWARAGYLPNVVQNWAGHSDIKTTLTYYTQAGEADLERAASQPLFDESDATLDATGTDGSAPSRVKPI
ncbi:MAG: hypothetical protein CMJ49_06000 [Planctomycetaceae bacterium]|nr:hypothetical protein [Planctomycetaceae bacterium]